MAKAVEDSTAPKQTLRVVFNWAYHDESMRFAGRGALRLQPPFRARTDLFGPRGETLMRSVAIGDSLFVPPGLPEGLMPPVSLGWASIGAVRPATGSKLEMTRTMGDTLLIGYSLGPEHWTYKLVGGKLRYAEWIGPNSGKRTIELKGNSSHGLPAEIVYRDWPAFRELTTTVEEVNESAPFPADTWDITIR